MLLWHGGVFIYVDMELVGSRVASAIDDEERKRLLGVGSSGAEFVKEIDSEADSIGVETVRFKRERELRELEIERKDTGYKPVLVDDVAVSGLTLQQTNEALSIKAQTAVVGMKFRSKRTTRRIGLGDTRVGLVYCREGGGNPPMNSIATLQQKPERLDELSNKYFEEQAEFFTKLIKGIKL